MHSQDITGEGYRITYDADTTTVIFVGELALGSPQDYSAINDLLNGITATQPTVITLDLKELAFLNSSGISMLSKFTLNLRKQTATQLVILGSSTMPWQSKSLKNLPKFLPSLSLEIE
jgi:hypothetical protein